MQAYRGLGACTLKRQQQSKVPSCTSCQLLYYLCKSLQCLYELPAAAKAHRRRPQMHAPDVCKHVRHGQRRCHNLRRCRRRPPPHRCTVAADALNAMQLSCHTRPAQMSRFASLPALAALTSLHRHCGRSNAMQLSDAASPDVAVCCAAGAGRLQKYFDLLGRLQAQLRRALPPDLNGWR